MIMVEAMKYASKETFGGRDDQVDTKEDTHDFKNALNFLHD
jgi:hypothetical protein